MQMTTRECTVCKSGGKTEQIEKVVLTTKSHLKMTSLNTSDDGIVIAGVSKCSSEKLNEKQKDV